MYEMTTNIKQTVSRHAQLIRISALQSIQEVLSQQVIIY